MSNSSLKQIVISPELFKIKNKTRKAGQKTAPVPMINPNVVKNKLLTRIKEHKKAEHSINPNKPNNANAPIPNPNLPKIKNANGMWPLTRGKEQQKIQSDIAKWTVNLETAEKDLKFYQSKMNVSK